MIGLGSDKKVRPDSNKWVEEPDYLQFAFVQDFVGAFPVTNFAAPF